MVLGANIGPFSEELVGAFMASDTWIHGAFALEQGFIFTAMVMSATTVYVIERKFRQAGLWCLVAAALASLGLIHSYQWTFSDTAVLLAPAWPWALGYGIMALCFLSAEWLTVPHDEG